VRIYIRGPSLGPIRTTLWSSGRRKPKPKPATVPVHCLLGVVANRHESRRHVGFGVAEIGVMGRPTGTVVPLSFRPGELLDAAGTGDRPGPASDIADGQRVALYTAGNSGRVRFIALKSVEENWWWEDD
jgi:hypothetical protein